MPGRLERNLPKCPQCDGWDMGGIGVVHHTAECPRNPCCFCSLPILQGDKRTIYGTQKRPCHYDCVADFELDRIEDQEARA